MNDTVENSVRKAKVTMQTICKHPCENDNCEYHPIAAPVNGEEVELKDLCGTENCLETKGEALEKD